MPAMKSYSRLRSADIKGLNDKAVVRRFVDQEKIDSLTRLEKTVVQKTIHQMKLDFALAALMSSDVMFAAGSEKALFERIDVLRSGPAEFGRGISSDFPDFMKDLLQIKFSMAILNQEGTVIPFGKWALDQSGIRGFVKSVSRTEHFMVAVNSSEHCAEVTIPKRIRRAAKCAILLSGARINLTPTELPDRINLPAGQILLLAAGQTAGESR
jgi:hypothetical protein